MRMKRHKSIAIDGPSGAGKSSMARSLAKRLGFLHVDTGAIYRAVGLAVYRHGKDPRDFRAVEDLLPSIDVSLRHGADGVQHMLLDKADVTDQIRGRDVSRYASQVSSIPAVRAFLLSMQRELPERYDVIMDGRDIGTVVLPHADVKLFLTASPEERAQRRLTELVQQGTDVNYDSVLRDIRERDDRDSSRDAAPLRKADDAVLVDSTGLSIEATLDLLEHISRDKLGM